MQVKERKKEKSRERLVARIVWSQCASSMQSQMHAFHVIVIKAIHSQYNKK